MGKWKDKGPSYRKLNDSEASSKSKTVRPINSNTPLLKRKRNCCRSCSTMKCTVITFAIALPVMVAALLAGKYAMGAPLHAQCTVQWTYGIPCEKVSMMLQSQIKKWTDASGCANGGEKCLYTFKSVTEKELKATHTTPVHHYVDDLSFKFMPESATMCSVEGYSRSTVIYAVLDYGTNYCNMHNLITGSGLDKVSGYTEQTSDDICTQYSTANCTKY